MRFLPIDPIHRVQVRSRGPVGRRGFTLLEVVITAAILTSLTFGSLLVMVPVARQSSLNREVDIANAEARKVLEKVQAAPFNEIAELFPPGTRIPIPGLEKGTVTVNYDDPPADPLFLRVTIAWDSRNSQVLSRTFTTVRTE